MSGADPVGPGDPHYGSHHQQAGERYDQVAGPSNQAEPRASTEPGEDQTDHRHQERHDGPTPAVGEKRIQCTHRIGYLGAMTPMYPSAGRMMTSIRIGLLAAALATLPLHRSSAQRKSQLDLRGRIKPEWLAAHVRFLSDRLLEGRETATPGAELAARYVAAEFEELGLEPIGPE